MRQSMKTKKVYPFHGFHVPINTQHKIKNRYFYAATLARFHAYAVKNIETFPSTSPITGGERDTRIAHHHVTKIGIA